MNLGAERKKVVFLAVLVLVGGYEFYANVLSDSSPAPAPQASRGDPAGFARKTEPAAPGSVRRATRARQSDEFRPTLKLKPEDAPDPATIDPTLRLDLLAKVQAVDLEGGARNLFQFSTPPPPPGPKDVPKVVPKTPAQIAQEAAKKNEPPKPAPPPPINLKYFGYSSARAGALKRAFFLDGDDILVAAEGELVKKRYRVVKIGVNSVVMEDTQSKSQQTLPLQEEAAG